MAVSDVISNETEKSKEAPKSKERKEKPLTKVVVRRLPPSSDLESFLMQVSPVPDYDYIYIVKGDMSLGENAFARVYINFVNSSDVFLFKEKFDNYVFVDHKGHEYPAVVEFSAFQKIPKKRKPRADPKSGTIESDPCYIEFLESLKEQPNQDVKPEFSYQFSTDSKDDIASTPLLDYIKQKRIDKQRIREERREERRKKELERKKIRDDDRKRHEFKPPSKSSVKLGNNLRTTKSGLDSVKEEASDKPDAKSKSDDEKEDSLSEKNLSPKHREHKYDDRKSYMKSKPRYSSRTEKSEYFDKKVEYKSRREDYREKEYRGRRFEDYKRDTDNKQLPRRTKKYSEKREERKIEAKKAEQKKIEEENDNLDHALSSTDNNLNNSEETKSIDDSHIAIYPVVEDQSMLDDKTELENMFEAKQLIDEESCSSRDDKEFKNKLRDNDPRLQRRIRNKDRPTMAIYQPGMLSKRRTSEVSDGDGQS